MPNLRRVWIVCLAISIILVDCTTTTSQSNTITNTPGTPPIDATLQPNNTFDLIAEQAQEVSVFMNFIHAYNHGRLDEALALLSDHVGISDCDYQNIKVVTFQEKSQVAEWLQQRISDHDRLEVSHIFNENPDTSSGRHVIEVTYSRSTSMTLAKLGFDNGITPTLASKVIFTSQPTLIQSFANGPYGGDSKLCHP